MRDDSDLSERLVAILDSGPRPVSADRAIEMANRERSRITTEIPYRWHRSPRRTAWAWLVLVVALVVVLVVAVRVASEPSGVRPASLVPSPVDLAATPKGWVPVDFGSAQVSVPSNWSIVVNPCPRFTWMKGAVFLQGLSQSGPPADCTAVETSTGRTLRFPYLPDWISLTSIQTTSRAQAGKERLVNGIKVYGLASGHGVTAWSVPSLGAKLTLSASASQVLNTLTFSPRSFVLSRSATPDIPASWKTVSFGGLTFSVPRGWQSISQRVWGDGYGCRPTDLYLLSNSVILNVGATIQEIPCPPINDLGLSTPSEGLLIDPGRYGPAYDNQGAESCRQINGLKACVSLTDLYGVLVLSIEVPGRSKPTSVEVGLAGSGQIARAILYSIRA